MTLPNLKCFLLFKLQKLSSELIESKLDVAPNVAHSLQITRNPVNKVQPFLIITKFNEKLRLGNLEIILIIEKTFGNKSTTLK
jgi:hypothetical protein